MSVNVFPRKRKRRRVYMKRDNISIIYVQFFHIFINF